VGIGATVGTAFASEVYRGLAQRAWAWPLAALIPAGLATALLASRRGRHGWAFAGSSAFLVGILASTAAGIYPNLLRSTLDPAASLTLANAAAGKYALGTGMAWWIVGMALAVSYFLYLFRSLRKQASGGY
jgi:cytochrome d ubiquinol oxidase subunit II